MSDTYKIRRILQGTPSTCQHQHDLKGYADDTLPVRCRQTWRKINPKLEAHCTMRVGLVHLLRQATIRTRVGDMSRNSLTLDWINLELRLDWIVPSYRELVMLVGPVAIN